MGVLEKGFNRSRERESFNGRRRRESEGKKVLALPSIEGRKRVEWPAFPFLSCLLLLFHQTKNVEVGCISNARMG